MLCYAVLCYAMLCYMLGLVTDGAEGLARVRKAISERKRASREPELPTGEVGRSARREAMRQRQAAHRIASHSTA